MTIFSKLYPLPRLLSLPVTFSSGLSVLRVMLTASVTVILAALSDVSAQQNSDQSWRWAGDVPLEPSLVIYPEQGMSFDSANARMMLIQATTTAENDQILGFYNSVLPSLGWQGEQGIYIRDDEQIQVKPVTIGGVVFWQILLSPRP